MTIYYDLSVIAHIIFGIVTLLLMVTAVFTLVNACVLHLKLRYLVLSSALLLEIMFMLQGIADVSLKQVQGISYIFFSYIIGNMPYALVILILFLSAAAETVLLVYIHRIKKNMLTPGAIKESLDTLPDGVCFYSKEGQPLLVNKQMNKISGELFDTEIMNAESFLSKLKLISSNDTAEIAGTEPTVVIQTQDEKTWSFRKNVLTIGNTNIQELIANDVSQQYRLNKDLKKRNERLSRVNERLRKYSREVEQITIEKEILEAKMKVHDDVGRSLLAFRSYLAQPRDKRDKDNLLILWRYTISVMKNETLPVVQSNEWDMLINASKAVGVKIELNGELPKESRIRTVLIAALHECLTNTVKHAKGNCLYLDIHSNNDKLEAIITNNGEQPKSMIVESGGLKNLRYAVESVDGVMTVEAVPRFKLVLNFQVKGE